MADVTVVAASVRPVDPRQCIMQRYTCAEAMTPGQPVYLSANDSVSLADGTAVATSFCIGVAVAGSAGAATIAVGEMVDVVLYGLVTGYTTNMAVNTLFFVDDDAGIISTAVGTKDTQIGIGVNASTMLVCPRIIDVS